MKYQELNLTGPVIINSSSNVTTDVLYNKIKQTQLLEILKISTSWVIGGLGVLFLNEFMTFLIIFFSVIYIGSYVFTYIKVINEKDEIIDKLTQVNLE